MSYLQSDNEDSLKLSLQEYKKIVSGMDFSELKEYKKRKAAINKKITTQFNLEKTKSKLLSFIIGMNLDFFLYSFDPLKPIENVKFQELPFT